MRYILQFVENEQCLTSLNYGPVPPPRFEIGDVFVPVRGDEIYAKSYTVTTAPIVRLQDHVMTFGYVVKASGLVTRGATR